MSHEKCVANGCNRDVFVKKHQLCRTHAHQLYMKGKVSNSPVKPHKRLKPFTETLQGLNKKKGKHEEVSYGTT